MEAAAILLFLFHLLCSSPSALMASIIPTSSSLSPATYPSAWYSDSGFFAFGFYETPTGYAVGIFLAGISDMTVVWTPTNFDPMLPNDVILLSLDVDSVQLFQNKQGKLYPYYDIATPTEAIAEASMLDNGNFVLYGFDGGVIWQSFDSPTDTLLPGQRLPTGQELVSRASETDLSKGKFRLKMQIDGNLVQYPVGTPDTDENAYYVSRSFGKGNNLSLNLESDGRLYLYNGVVSYNIAGGAGGGGNFLERSIHMARVDPDGIFRLYDRPLDREAHNWTVRWSSTNDTCVPKGICGVNSYCTHENEGVACTCLPGFGNGTCTEDVDVEVESCRNKSSSVRYEMRALKQLAWDENSYEISASVGEQECGGLCLDDCDCVVALFKDGMCRKQAFPMRYGRRSSSPKDSYTALVRVSLPLEAPNASGLRPRQRKKGLYVQHKWVIIGMPIGVAALVVSSIFVWYRTNKSGFRSRDEESKQIVDKFVLNHGSLALKRYTYKEIRRITKSFTEKLGQGGYGVVYRGKLPQGELVAVKVLKETHDNVEEFINEVASISRTSHVNIVNLLGFCFERRKRALVYEFMPNKSLDKYIYKRGSIDAECSLEWNKLYEIAVGVARGLEYLHRGCNTRIVHFDIKPQNILLDEEFCPKISDFGLAKLCKKKQSVISMLGTRGTIGYIAPEVFSRNFGLVSHKSDVYSYGIMLLQMAQARTNIVEVKSFQSTGDYFLEKIYEHVLVQNEKAYDEISEEEEEAVRKMLMVGFWCIQTAPSDRPSMNKVVDMLEGNVQSIQIPPLPFLLSSPKPEFSCSLPVIVETRCSSESENC